MSEAPRVRAVLFDMDGTLIDSEMHTDRAVSAVVARYGVKDFVLPVSETRGRTWAHVAAAIRERTNIVAPVAELADGMLEFWTSAIVDVQPVPGAAEAVRAAASRKLRLGVVSSSPRFLIDSCLEKLGVADHFPAAARIGSDAVRQTKPDPEGYLLAAKALAVDPREALVFEDSRAGLMAARAAGMRSVFVTCCAVDVEENKTLATAACPHYGTLPAGFWDELAAGTIDLKARALT